jgi:hypothetical protein
VIAVDTGLAVVPAELEVVDEQRQAARRAWAAIMLTTRLEVCRSILRGAPVLAGSLDPVVLRHALRGSELPPAGDYITVTADMLDAVDEAGPYTVTRKRGRR